MDNAKDVLDMLSYNMAKAYTDKVVGEAKTRVIDLDEYGIGQVVLGLFANGGGNMSVETPEQFWYYASTERVPRLVMTGMGSSFVIDQCARAFDGNGDRAVQIAFAVMFVYNGAIYNMNVAVQSGGDLTTVYVTVT